MRLRLLIVVTALPILLWAVLPLGSGAAPTPQRLDRIEERLEAARERIGRKKGAERVLASDIAAYSARINRLQGRITSLSQRQAVLQADLDRKKAELIRIQDELRDERARLVRLRARLRVVRRRLAQRLVEMYKAERPDMVTVVLSSRGFADLLSRGEFLSRVSAQDGRVMRLVTAAKRDAVRTERRLDALERRQQRLTAQVLARRNEVAQVKQQLVGTRVGYAKTRAGKRVALSKVRSDRRRLERHAHGLEREQAKVQAALQRAAARSDGARGAFAGPVRQGSGSLIWPVNGGISSPFGQRWGRLHAGVDIPAPEGTPIRAADSGKVVLLGWTGGYGNYTCVQHNASLSTCYAHQSRYGTSNGASVSKGQVIGYVGNTGNSFGAHLHFETRVGGSPVDPMGYL